jgi:hypothetical protein
MSHTVLLARHLASESTPMPSTEEFDTEIEAIEAITRYLREAITPDRGAQKITVTIFSVADA